MISRKPILENILEQFIDAGFYKFFLAIRYKADMIIDHFGNGEKWGVEINYILEEEPLGTAGALGLLPKNLPSLPLIVMNGDVLTLVDFESLLHFHEDHNAEATMGVREYDYQIPYGVVSTDKYFINAIHEKPVERYYVNSGIYVLNPTILEMVPQNTFFDMPDLYRMAIEKDLPVTAFPVREYWLDIGSLEDLEKAHKDVKYDLRISNAPFNKEI